MQPAAEAIAAELADEARAQRLRGAHQGWARVLALLLAASAQLPSGEELPQRLPADWQPVLAEALAETLRWVYNVMTIVVYSGGVRLPFLAMHCGGELAALGSSFCLLVIALVGCRFMAGHCIVPFVAMRATKLSGGTAKGS